MTTCIVCGGISKRGEGVGMHRSCFTAFGAEDLALPTLNDIEGEIINEAWDGWLPPEEETEPDTQLHVKPFTYNINR